MQRQPEEQIRALNIYIREGNLMLFQKYKRIRDKNHLAFIRSLPCAKCVQESKSKKIFWKSEACHIRKGTNGALGRRPGDDYTLPLCPFHHRRQHQIGEVQFYKSVPKAVELAQELYWANEDRVRAMELIVLADI